MAQPEAALPAYADAPNVQSLIGGVYAFIFGDKPMNPIKKPLTIATMLLTLLTASVASAQFSSSASQGADSGANGNGSNDGGGNTASGQGGFGTGNQ
jgi:hypothetical protein